MWNPVRKNRFYGPIIATVGAQVEVEDTKMWQSYRDVALASGFLKGIHTRASGMLQEFLSFLAHFHKNATESFTSGQ
jgi:hypothetical protein